MLSDGKGLVLDIGANLGFFAHKLESLGFQCVALENDPLLTRYMMTVRDASRCQFEIITGSILERGVVEGRHFRAVLALNVFHHFLKTRQDFSSLKRSSGRLELRRDDL